ncbi:MAG: hypothetical protein OSA36_06170 [Acidimicrobiales bacterium]|jgi:hypothetical protein|nr:hypothetical protein [Acidimicrobiales bacterium]
MPKTIDRTLPIRRYKKVVATVELPGVPEGTVGKVRVANGFAWYRYWVDFDNGVRMGQVSHDNLCHQDDWGRFQFDRAETERRALETPEDSVDSDEGDEGAAGAVGNQFGVPEHLIQRSLDARKRVGA